MGDPFYLCLHLDEQGCPCNRRTMKPLSMCGQHRPAPVPVARKRGPTAEYQRARRARLAAAGLSLAMESAG